MENEQGTTGEYVLDTRDAQDIIDEITRSILDLFADKNISIDMSYKVLERTKRAMDDATKWNRWGLPLTYKTSQYSIVRGDYATYQ
jgi:hypothetical protein